MEGGDPGPGGGIKQRAEDTSVKARSLPLLAASPLPRPDIVLRVFLAGPDVNCVAGDDYGENYPRSWGCAKLLRSENRQRRGYYKKRWDQHHHSPFPQALTVLGQRTLPSRPNFLANQPDHPQPWQRIEHHEHQRRPPVPDQPIYHGSPFKSRSTEPRLVAIPRRLSSRAIATIDSTARLALRAELTPQSPTVPSSSSDRSLVRC